MEIPTGREKIRTSPARGLSRIKKARVRTRNTPIQAVKRIAAIGIKKYRTANNKKRDFLTPGRKAGLFLSRK